MPLDAVQTKQAMRAFVRDVFVQGRRTANVNSDDIENAVTDLATFIEDNTVAINNALPEPFKSTASIGQKRHLFGIVSEKLAGLT